MIMEGVKSLQMGYSPFTFREKMLSLSFE
jgi:hypothetical protein